MEDITLEEDLNIADVNVEKELKIVFMGTPDFAVPVLEALIENYNVRAIVTQPDKEVGRDRILKPTPIKEVGMKNMILVLQPNKIREEYEEILALDPDLIITCAYGQIIPKGLLNYPRLGCINVHASLLPKLRGGAPIHRAIINGFKNTGVTIMYMNEYMDKGDIISSKSIPIEDTDTASTLHDKLSILGRDLLIETLPSIIDGTNTRTKQEDFEASYGYNITREDEHIDFSKTSRQVFNQIRGLNSWPGAYTTYDGKVLKVWSSRLGNNFDPAKANGEIVSIYEDGFGVKTSDGEIVLTNVQPEGKTKMDASSFINGERNKGPMIGKLLK
ncbi:MAG: methionyl-tRNA formyltransferase [Bacilli bacterium]|nr:methionyl-tRNA formyltransferase [Bacilli bacterium]